MAKIDALLLYYFKVDPITYDDDLWALRYNQLEWLIKNKHVQNLELK